MATSIDRAIKSTPTRDPSRWLGWMCLLTAAATLGYGVAAYASGAGQVMDALNRIGFRPLAFALAATVLSLALRVVRWQTILRTMGHWLHWPRQVRVYLAGLALSSTPAKLGETARSALLYPAVPLAHSLAAFVCDRLADVVAVSVLGALGAAFAGDRQPVLECLGVVGALGSLVAARWWPANPGGQPRTGAAGSLFSSVWARRLAAPAAAWARAWTPGRAALFVLLGVLAYGCQAAAFTVFVGQVHVGLSAAACVLIFASSTLIGAASMVPGGLGTMDAALIWQLRAHAVPADAALAAALAARATTLWFAWLVGVVAMLSFNRGARRAR